MPKILTSKGAYDITYNPSKAGEDGEVYIQCPICTPHRKREHQKERKLAINVLQDPHRWRCNHCGEGGYVKTDDQIKRQEIKPLPDKYETKDPTPTFYDYIERTRGIKKETVKKLKIGAGKQAVRQSKHPDPDMKGKILNTNVIYFRYILNGELINIKFRDKRKNFKLVSGADKIFYNMDSIQNYDWCVITEGEFDTAAYTQAGIEPVVSVPNGVNISVEEKELYEKTKSVKIFNHLNLDYLDRTIDRFKNMKVIYIATDDDPAGIKLREELGRRLGKERCRFIKFSDYTDNNDKPINDPNQLLIEKGEKVLARTLDQSYEFPIEGVIRVSDYIDTMNNIYEFGYERGFSTGYKSLDPHFNWMKGWTIALNGYPSEGKTTFALNLIAISTVLYDMKWGIYSPENYPINNIVDSMVEIFLDGTLNKDLPGKRIERSEMNYVMREHMNNHIYFIDNEDGYTPDDLRNVKKDLIKRYGINAFFTDPWSALTHPMGNNKREDLYLQQQLNAETRLSKAYNLINLISHHPPTPRVGFDKLDVPSPFQMIGGQIWFNKVYAILCIHKINREDSSDTKTGIHIQKIKEHKLAGLPTAIANPVVLDFKRRSGRLLERKNLRDPNSKYCIYPFEKWNAKEKKLFDDF